MAKNDWMAESDAYTIKKYNEIMQSSKRKKAAMDNIKKQTNELNSVLKRFGGSIKRKK